MKSIIIIFVAALAACSFAMAIDNDVARQGFSLAFQLGQEYQKIQRDGGDPTTYNSLVDQWNAFVQVSFGQDAGLFMQKMDASTANIQKPFVLGKNTTNIGVVHSIDGSTKYGASWITNDINLLPDSAIAAYHSQDQAPGGAHQGDGYLGGWV